MALLHVTPYYNRPSQEGLFRHFEAIAKSTKLPIILYNVPTRTACDLLTDTVVRLARLRQHHRRSRTRPATSCAAASWSRRSATGSTVLSGDDGTAFPLYAVGARGVISRRVERRAARR